MKFYIIKSDWIPFSKLFQKCFISSRSRDISIHNSGFGVKNPVCHFEDMRSKLEWKNQTFLSSFLSWQFQLNFAKPYGQGLLHQWPGHSPNLNLIENFWRPVPILISFHPHFISFHFIPFHSIPMPLPILIQTTCLWSVTAPKQIDRFWCDWPQSLAFFKLYMIHVKISKIDQ